MCVITRRFISAVRQTDIDSIDRDLILLITKGLSSSYSMWAFMKNNSEGRVMAYINVNKRITRLAKLGYLEEIRPNPYIVNIHGRKDYKVTKKGVAEVIPNILENPADVKDLFNYIEAHGLDKEYFGELLTSRLANANKALIEYWKLTNLPKSEIPFNVLSKLYGGCKACASFSLQFPKYIVSRQDGTSSFREPKLTNEKLFLKEYRKFIDHFDREHKNLKSR